MISKLTKGRGGEQRQLFEETWLKGVGKRTKKQLFIFF